MQDDRAQSTFIRALRNSKAAVRTVAMWLVDSGYAVIHRPTFERPNFEERADYTDNEDLEVVQKVAVKQQRKGEWTSRETFKFDNIIVDSLSNWKKKHPKPYMYLIVNKYGTFAFLVHVKSTFKHWKKINVFDSVKQCHLDFWECPIAVMKFVDLRPKHKEE